MVIQILEGISNQLHRIFRDSYTIYRDPDENQALERPAFLLRVLSPSQIPRLGRRYFREHPFDVQYYPAELGNAEELHQMAFALFEHLEYIMLPDGEEVGGGQMLPDGDLLRGSSMRYEILEGVLHFYVNYNLFLQREDPRDYMEDLTIEQNI